MLHSYVSLNVSLKPRRELLVFLQREKQPMAKQRDGYVYQEPVWYAVVEYKDQSGNPQKIERRGNNKAHAEELAGKLTRQIEEEHGASVKCSSKLISRKEGWRARLTYIDETGKRRSVKRQAGTKTEAKEELKKLIAKLDNQGEKAIEGDRLTFGELAQIYEERNLVPAEYQDGRKIRGLRNHLAPLVHLRVVTEHFGAKRVKNITHSDIEV